jgi:hypothetical protein
LWITIVIHSAFGCGGTVISPHPLVICIKKREKRKNRKVEKKVILKKKMEKLGKKKEEESIVDYCCNPQCFWVWGNNDFPTPFSYMYNKYHQ